MNMNSEYQSELSATIKFLKEKADEWEKGIHLLFGTMKKDVLYRVLVFSEAAALLESEQP